jgi:geranylgeranyl pyrophosphate synthase
VSPGDRSAESVLEHVSTWDAYARRWRDVLLAEQARLLLSEDAEGAFSEALAYVRRIPGKQVRPLLVLAACELTRGDPKVAISTACALEFLHTSSLIFDDLPCMDNSERRRGLRCLHAEFGEYTAILVGLVLFNLAHELLGSAYAPTVSRQLLRQQAVGALMGARGMMLGQLTDLARRSGGNALGRRIDLQVRKTTSLITASLVAGAYSGHATPEEIASLREVGRETGWAYQLMDDELDIAEDPAVVRLFAGRSAAARRKQHLLSAVRHLETTFPRMSEARGVLTGFAHLAASRCS